MPSVLTTAEVERIARLAHLALTSAEKELFTKQLGEILAYAELVQQVDTTGVAPTSHVLAAHGASRPDERRPSIRRSEALAGGPDVDPNAGLFKVPRVLA